MKTVLITGSSSGFGKATAQLFLDHGWNVIATMRRPQDDLFSASSNNLRVIALDVTDAESVRAAVSEAIGAFGGVDVLVNNAGFGVFLPFETTSDELIRSLFETNTLGVIAMVRAILPHMRERGSGAIVNVTSSVVFSPMALVSAYAATKTAVEGFSEALYHELALFGIHVKLVEPGYGPDTKFRTSMMALNDANSFPAPYQPQLDARMSNLSGVTTTLEDVANAVLRAANDTGATLRYPAGADAVASAKMRARLSEDDFLAPTRRLSMQSTTGMTTCRPLRTLPLRLHHHAYTTDNHETTRHFYEDILGLPLMAMYTEREHVGDELIELGHAFYGLGDGSALAFFNFADPVKQREWRAKEQSLFIHISLKVEQSTQDEIRERIQAAGIDRFTIDHGYCQSLYFGDPNGLQLEFTVDPPEAGEINARMARTAHADLRRWVAGGRESNNHWRVDEENSAVV